MAQTQVSGSGIKNNVITNNHLHSAANIASSKLANSGVTSGSYGSGSATLSLTINAKGVITAASTNAISIGTSNISNNSVTFAKLVDINVNQIIGRLSSGSGDPEALNPSQIRSIINVEDGATADQTASEILTLIKTVDGAGSGLDADTLDGISSGQFLRSDASDSYNCVGNALAFNFDTNNRNSITFTLNGTVYWQFLHDNGGADLDIDRVAGGGNLKVNGSRILSTADEGSGQGLDSDTVDGIEANQFLRKDTTSTFNCNGNALNFDFDNVGRNSLAFTLNGSTYWQFVHDNGGQDFNIDRNAGSGIVKIDGNKVFHAGNDGAGSGLDSDRLDGQEGAHYLDASNLNAGTLPSARIGSATVPSPTSSISIMGNFGQWQAHGTYQNFNTDVAYWGWNFMNNNTNAPTSASGQWYRSRLSLGTGYGIGTASNNYWLEMAIPRYNHTTAGQMYIRSCENGSIGSWTEVGSRPRNHVIPYANNQIDLGSTTVRWRNLFTNDLNLSNEGSSNDVDMTWGSFTIQEGHYDLFLINKRTGKKYKFNLTEVK